MHEIKKREVKTRVFLRRFGIYSSEKAPNNF